MRPHGIQDLYFVKQRAVPRANVLDPSLAYPKVVSRLYNGSVVGSSFGPRPQLSVQVHPALNLRTDGADAGSENPLPRTTHRHTMPCKLLSCAVLNTHGQHFRPERCCKSLGRECLCCDLQVACVLSDAIEVLSDPLATPRVRE
jgi:hypothetical protein